MNARVFISDPAAVPAGTTHVRVMNAISDHQPLQIVQCPSSFDSNWTYTESDCAPVGAPIAYGDVYETDATPDVVGKLGFHWAGAGATSPSAVTPINRAGAGAFIMHIPTELSAPQDRCPTCFMIDL